MKRLYLGLLFLATGCAPFQPTGNWMGPALFAMPTPSITDVTLDGQGQAGSLAATDVEISAGGPFEVKLAAFKLEYLDQAGRPVDALAAPEVSLEPAVSVGGATRKATVHVPVVSPAVVAYGAANKEKPVINCRVTFKGTDGTGSAMEILANVPIRFNRPTP
jgi:hypothetical protein